MERLGFFQSLQANRDVIAQDENRLANGPLAVNKSNGPMGTRQGAALQLSFDLLLGGVGVAYHRRPEIWYRRNRLGKCDTAISLHLLSVS